MSAPADDHGVHIDGTILSMAKLRAEHRENATPMQSLVETMVKALRRPRVVGEISALIVGWVAFNLALAALGFHMIDPPPFAWLEGAVSMVALYMAVLILVSREREDLLSRHREMLLLELAILSEEKIAKVIQLLEESRRDNPLIHDRRDADAESMGRAADTRRVLDAITEKPPPEPA
ncbi:hypothetical protein CCR94_15315 [Rhodoblastus sphagnicola]|uniref:DUF1003 domain-containing protein n=1 Tax=Rhodoblastus sphagnicola TaxID=333368 RepID=A0A2S6N4D8_9HYPH|nr:DUF1003 domain-containing protein [Rhodoblastus sphagnicola]MBB4200329.1 putative membrane protein [Rhodoblastus sphagnicola]PPQ29472.1 hypothetical protein CCR94_15315 [Rhodoblastus sphagnicola]